MTTQIDSLHTYITSHNLKRPEAFYRLQNDPILINYASKFPLFLSQSETFLASRPDLSLLQVNESRHFTAFQARCLINAALLGLYLETNDTPDQRRRAPFKFHSLWQNTANCSIQKLRALLLYVADPLADEDTEKNAVIQISLICAEGLLWCDLVMDRVSRLSAVEVKGATDRMEDVAREYDRNDSVLLDFANQEVGGGVLGNGAAQEEILFICNPELLLARLICPVLRDSEAIRVSNVRRVVDYTGYMKDFRICGKVLGDRHRFNHLIADATNYNSRRLREKEYQFQPFPILREINKLLVGLRGWKRKVFVTGNWGCGCFGGDRRLKFLLQWIACSLSGVERMIFCPFQASSELASIISDYRDQFVYQLADQILLENAFK